MNGDLIDSLPIDKNFLHTDQQLHIADVVFRQHQNTVNAVANELKEGILISILFIVFSSTQIDDFIKRSLPITNSSVMALMGIKCVSLVIIFYFIKNFSLSRK